MSLREVRGEPYGAVPPHFRTAIHLVSSLDVSGLGVESVEACFGASYSHIKVMAPAI